MNANRRCNKFRQTSFRFSDLSGGIADPDHIWDYKMMWRPMIAQKLPLVCYKSGSDEIVGASMLFALTKDDDFLDQINMRVISSVSV